MSWYDLPILYTEQGKQENGNKVEQQILESALEHLNFIHILLFKSFLFFLKVINTFIQQDCISLIKSDSKEIYNFTKVFYFK